MSMNLTFEEAAFGLKKEIRFPRTERCKACRGTGAKGGTAYTKCPSCGGTGKVQYVQDTMFGRAVSVRPCNKCGGTGNNITEKCPECGGKGLERKTVTLTVDVPAGVDNGQTLTVKGEGEAGKNASGDLRIQINVMPHKLFKRQDTDLFLTLPITFTQAILGDKVRIPGLKGPLELTIPEGTQGGDVLRIKGHGIKQLRREAYGDILVTIVVEVPKKLSAAQRDAVKRLADGMDENAYEKVRDFKKKL
jgi:molecular chaperone DnaJ